ncbi:hypothetical protein TWF225_002166 [Orbilia oligospora]|uniref:Uncharacterized protein n=1 Tax=Orbilia oligospora TaxID=2813651 RepID=A0A7C8PGF7_ORBOL|nr:hypothetical protein TWF751_009083 [Orbilia oligospora]KAF3190405.1 hypothetical protein TWF225_002166 [Orbilia oligospora]KAF3242627.1 hypothetical protein TWF217_011487 [Orbilia oligospora]KAF3257982.1 hypothetical protein TWF128_004882 [Orbilia oligospora]KAF3286366.1 hypothetical protein TWF132_008937 [Orbilia oligospora]
MKRTTSIRLQSNLARANSGKDGRQLLDAIADVHYFISVPEERPSHSTFERGTKVGLFLKEDTGRIRIRFHDAVNPKNCALSGDISVLRLEFGNDQECFVRAEIDYGEDHGVSLGSDWMVAAPDECNEGMHNWRPFCVDLYFWKHSMADYFARIVEEYQKRIQVQQVQQAQIQQVQAEAKLKAISPIREQPPSRTPSNRSSQLARTPEPEMQLKTRTSNIEDEDDEEMFKKNIMSVDCLDSHTSEIFPVSGGTMECRVIKNQVKKTTKIRVSAPIDGGYIKLCYTLTDRSFPYQLPESTVQVRFMLVEKSVTANPGANIEHIIDAAPLDSPTFQFEQDDHAQIFLECLRGEQLLLNSIVDWVRCTRELKEGETSTAGPHPANFTCADDRRVQLWENELGFINIVFHRQFHLVSAFVAPSTQVEAEAEASTLKVSGIKIRKLEQSPTLDAKEPWRTEGSPAVLKLRFVSPEHVVSFRDAVLRHRDATAMMYPEVAKTLAKSIAHENPGANVPPPPPPEFRHQRAMSASGGLPPPPTSPPQQYPASPQSPPAHQTSFTGYGLTHSQSVRINRPPPLPMFPGQPGSYVPGSINSPRYNAQPSPMTGTFSPGNIGTFPISAFPSPPGASSTMPYQSPAAVASGALPQIQPMSNAGYFPATITPMTPGLPSAKFPPPLQTSMIITSSQAQAAQQAQQAQQQPPATPIREHMRKNSFATRNDTIQESVQIEPVELPASFPDAPPYESEPRKEERDSLMIRRFPKDDDIAEEEESEVRSGYNPLGGNVSIPIAPVTARATGGGEREQSGGGKMSRVWKKLK